MRMFRRRMQLAPQNELRNIFGLGTRDAEGILSDVKALIYTEGYLLKYLIANWLQSPAKQHASKFFVKSCSLILNLLARCMKVIITHCKLCCNADAAVVKAIPEI